MITAQDAEELLKMGHHHNVAGATFTTDGNAAHTALCDAHTPAGRH
jgi:hypothetical protein